MARNFITRTTEDHEDAAMDAVAGRENELASYDENVAAYTKQLSDMDSLLPATWPAELEKFRGKSNEQIFVIGGTAQEMDTAAALNHRERVRMLLFTEKAERAKSEAAYVHALTLLPSQPAAKTAALIRYNTRKAAQKAKANG